MRRTFKRSLEKQGMKFMLTTKVNSAKREGDSVTLELEPAKGGEKKELTVDVVLVSAGMGGGGARGGGSGEGQNSLSF